MLEQTCDSEYIFIITDGATEICEKYCFNKW